MGFGLGRKPAAGGKDHRVPAAFLRIGRRSSRLLAVAFLADLLAASATSAPGLDKVLAELKSCLNRDAVHAGETFRAAIRLTIAPGWHVNANPASGDLFVPTTLELADTAGRFKVGEVSSAAAIPVRFAFSESEIAVYSGSVDIFLTLEAAPALAKGSYELKGAVRWQACNDVSCLPPEATDFAIEVVVAAPGATTKAVHAEIFREDEPK
jgi:DsbC/DsbD-like thiol-disulfide interchange protein